MKKLLLIGCMLSVFMLSSCGESVKGLNSELKQEKTEENITSGNYVHYSTTVIVDKETGVNYIMATSNINLNGGVAITPRYNTDGSIYISK